MGDASSRKRKRGRGSILEGKSEPGNGGMERQIGFLFEREDGTSRFFLTLPNPGKGESVGGDARCRRVERGRRPSPEGRSNLGDGRMDRRINFSI